MYSSVFPNGKIIMLVQSLSEQVPLKGGSVDLIVTDPPFNLGIKYETIDDGKTKEEYIEWMRECVTEFFRVLKPTGSIYIMNHKKWLGYLQVMMDDLGIFRNLIAWRLAYPPSRKNYLMMWQGILFYSKTKDYYFDTEAQVQPHRNFWGFKDEFKHEDGMRIDDIWQDIPKITGGCMASKEAIFKEGTKEKAHPCQWPRRLVERMIVHSSKPGDIVYDPFMGSGVTVSVSNELGRVGVGSDLGYFHVSKGMTKQVQKRMFI